MMAVLPGWRRLLPSGQDSAGAAQVARDDRPAGAHRQPGRPGPVGLPPAVGAAAALGEDQQAPAFPEQRGGPVGRVARHPLALDGHGVEGEGERRRLEPGVEEVVGGAGHHRPVAPPIGKIRQQQRGVEVAGVVGREDDRLVEVGDAVQPVDRRRGQRGHHRAGSPGRRPGPGPGGPGSGGPSRCRSPRRGSV